MGTVVCYVEAVVGPLTPSDVRNVGINCMKKPNTRLLRAQEKRRKKGIARRQVLAQRARQKNLIKELDKPHGLAPRYIRRKKDLEGLTYWRGARSVLVNK